MELSNTFEHGKAEEHWYQHWLDRNYFHSEPDGREPYTIVIPPPNVTGVLHMGHCLNNTIQDILVRRARLMGRNACWVPGTDHASIATEAKVVRMLRDRGITKSSLTRDEFLAYAWEWKEKYGGIILQQLRKLGCSLDWERTTFTMDPHYYDSVISVFNDLYNKGFIYRGKRMINWDVRALTALSDEEVIRRQTNQKLYHLRYLIEGTDEYITIATVRPETIMGDTAIAVHPDDERYKQYHGKRAIIPLVNRSIPIITDDYVTVDFGTGALKVTPAHDMNDNLLGQKHGLEVIDIFNDDGTLNELAGMYIGEDRIDARKKIARDLEQSGALVKTEDYSSEVGYSERTDAVVEPRLSMQWWIDMKKISDPALRAVLDEEIKFYPPKFRNLYRHWMENIKDWCISRQLWWGQRIPAWYDEAGNFVVAKNAEEALGLFHKQGNTSATAGSIRQDEDCLDTWFSSWLWPIEVFRGYSEPDNADINYYYPTNTLVTAPEIIFFWVARMIMAGYEYKGAKPFSEVYFTGIVRDKQGRKMSKSLGNSPDLLGLIDQYGADACRFGILISSPAGNDLLWDESANQQGAFFNNKIWNALKLVKMWEGRQADNVEGSADAGFAVDWFASRLAQARTQMDEQFRDFRLSEALKTAYSLIWDDFCSWYLEWVKPGFEQPISREVYTKTVRFFEELMQLLHPFMPFITEEIYHQLREKKEDLTVSLYPAQSKPDEEILGKAELLKNVITAIRDARNKSQLKPKDTIRLFIQPENKSDYTNLQGILSKQVNAVEFAFTSEAVAQSISGVTGKDRFFLVTTAPLDTSSQREQLQRDLDYQVGFLKAVEIKLSNERFVSNAKPEVVEMERKKKADAEAKIQAIREGLANI